MATRTPTIRNSSPTAHRSPACLNIRPKKTSISHWLTDLPDSIPDPQEAYRELFNPAVNDKTKVDQLMAMTQENTSQADYVWLPVRFDGEMAYLDWHDEWRIEDYD